MMALTIRPARQEDQETMLSYVRQARINRRNLHWQNSLVAEEDQKKERIRIVLLRRD
jgi:hypothetical protein